VKRRALLGSAAQATELLQPRLSSPAAHGGKVVVSARSQSTPHNQAPQPFVPTPTHNPFSRSYRTAPSSTARYSAPPHAPSLHEPVDASNRRAPHGIGIRARTTGSQKSVSENGSGNRRREMGGISGAFVDGRQRQTRGGTWRGRGVWSSTDCISCLGTICGAILSINSGYTFRYAEKDLGGPEVWHSCQARLTGEAPCEVGGTND
jgi:hypothetical protein